MITGQRFLSLKRYTFVDVEDTEVGSIEDLVLSPNSLFPTHLVLGAGFFEEYLEVLGKKPDIDELAEIFLMEIIDNDVIYINKSLDDLIKTDENGIIPFPSILFSELQKYSLEDIDGKIDCELLDFEISGEHSMLIFSHNEIQEEMIQRGYKQRFELIIPLSTISINDSKLKIALSKDEIINKIEKDIPPKMTGKSIVKF